MDLFFPKQIKCMFCGRETKEFGICEECIKLLPYVPEPTCLKCGGRKTGEGDVCIECKDKTLNFERCYCVFEYKDMIQDKIISFKQAGYKYIGETFAWLISKKLQEVNLDLDLIIPVPISDERRKERGFNQSEVLCQEIDSTVPIMDNILSRTHDTPHQTGLSKSNRQRNLLGAFKVLDKSRIKGKTILLVDDIYTTGSTLNECSKTLLKGGAKKVYALCLARASYKLDKVIN